MSNRLVYLHKHQQTYKIHLFLSSYLPIYRQPANVSLYLSSHLSIHLLSYLAVHRINVFLIGIVGGGVQLGPLGTAAINRPIVSAQGDYDDEEEIVKL
jgi:hypothetical protein